MNEDLENRSRRGIRERIGAYLHPEPNYDIKQATDDELCSVADLSRKRVEGWLGGGGVGVVSGCIVFFDGLDVQDRSGGQMIIGVGIAAVSGVVSFVKMTHNLAANFDAGKELQTRRLAEAERQAEVTRELALARQLTSLVLASEVNPALSAAK